MATLLRGSVVGTIVKPFFLPTRSTVDAEHAKETNNAAPDFSTTILDEYRLVTWNGKDDSQNPLNWPFSRKCVVTAILNYYTFAIFIGSSLYTPSQDLIIERFNVSHTEAELGLALYVLGYGAGSLIFSPLTEIPAIGRNPPYAISGTLFIALCFPSATVDDYASHIVLRFLLGFLASPCLATVVASYADIWGDSVAIAVAIFAAVASLSPALGPVVAAYAVQSMGWQFWAWELLAIAGPAWLLMICMVPETSAPTILYYRAKQIRRETGDTRIASDAEMKQSKTKLGSTLWFALVKPWEINIKDPAMLFATIYTGLSYGLVYAFLEAVPLVYPLFYDFSPTSTSLVFLTTAASVPIAFTIQTVYLVKRVLPKLKDGTFGELENFLLSGIAGSPLMPIGLFIFGWTSRPQIHWFPSLLGMSLIMLSIFFTQQSIFLYIGAIYPAYSASIFAANSLARSLFAFAAVLVTRPMIEALGVGGGCSVLAGLCLGCCLGMVGLFWWGRGLRARSRFAG